MGLYDDQQDDEHKWTAMGGTPKMPNDLVGTYRRQDIADARDDLERLRRDCHETFIICGGNSVFLYVKHAPTRHDDPKSET